MVLAREISVEESGMGGGEGGAEWSRVHAACVAYVAALGGGAGGAAAGGVWREHSYARATRRTPRHEPRTLLAPATDSDEQDGAPLDVGSEGAGAGPTLPALPCDAVDDDDDAGADGGDDEWEARVAALAPSAAHARLAVRAADILRDMRLARLASSKAGRALRREQARAAASKLRRALAPTWLWSGSPAGGGGGGGGGAAWLYSVLSAYLPRPLRALLEETLDELRRAAPRLAARLPAPRRAPPTDPLSPSETTIPVSLSAPGPLVVWVSAGRDAADARWARRLAALLPTRTVPPPAGRGAGAGGRAPPDVWCAQQAAAARVALNDALAEAGSRPVFLAGFSAGAALCCALAAGVCGGGAGGAGGDEAARGGGGRVRGVALLAPPLVSAEGEEALDVKTPMLIIAGSSAGGAGGGRPGALEACAGQESRRLVVVWGADDALRLPARLLQRARLPRQALHAAIVEEVVRWVHELADAEEDDDQSVTTESACEVIDVDDDEYAHLPSPWSPPAPVAPVAPPPHPADTRGGGGAANNNIQLPQPVLGTSPRAIEIVEGRVVSRVSGSTPLMLTPRRAPLAPAPPPAPAAPPAPPAPADIMKMPIVFADDEPAAAAAALPAKPEVAPSPVEAPLTVTSGAGRGGSALKYTRVIVAKRGAGAGGGGVPAPRAPPAAAPRGRGGARPVLLRRAVRVVGRVRSRPQKDQ